MTSRRAGESSREWIDRVGPVRALGELLEEAGARVTLDMERDVTKPCIMCGTTDRPRDLYHVATVIEDRGQWERGDEITRPVCIRCVIITGLERLSVGRSPE